MTRTPESAGRGYGNGEPLAANFANDANRSRVRADRIATWASTVIFLVNKSQGRLCATRAGTCELLTKKTAESAHVAASHASAPP